MLIICSHVSRTDASLFFFQGKVFPKLKNRCPQGSSDSVSDKEEEEATDYVFRIIFPNSQSEFGKRLNHGIKQALEPVNVSWLWDGYYSHQLLEVNNREKGLFYPLSIVCHFVFIHLYVPSIIIIPLVLRRCFDSLQWLLPTPPIPHWVLSSWPDLSPRTREGCGLLNARRWWCQSGTAAPRESPHPPLSSAVTLPVTAHLCVHVSVWCANFLLVYACFYGLYVCKQSLSCQCEFSV